MLYLLKTSVNGDTFLITFLHGQLYKHNIPDGKKGVFRSIHEYLRQTLRVLLGKSEDASAGIVDSQSVKTTEKGGLKVVTEVKKLREEKDI